MRISVCFIFFITAFVACDHFSDSSSDSWDDDGDYSYGYSSYHSDADDEDSDYASGLCLEYSEECYHCNELMRIECNERILALKKAELEVQMEEQACVEYYRSFPNIPYPQPPKSDRQKGKIRLPVKVVYAQTENIGPNYWLVLEAFDNALFIGSPVEIVTQPGFDATRAGNDMVVPIYLDHSQYYLRAYLVDVSPAIPFELGGLELIKDKPVGVLGVLSSPLAVTPSTEEKCPPPVELGLNQTFRSSEITTEARIRLMMTHSTPENIEPDKDLIMQLRTGDDLEQNPIKEWRMSSNGLLIRSQLGKAEYVTEQLELGRYFLTVFIDQNANGYIDIGEWFTEMVMVKVEGEKTLGVNLEFQEFN